jgi:hypothetical protein
MNIKRLVIIFLLMIMAGCSKEPKEHSTVPDEKLAQVLEFVNSNNFDDAVRLGKTVLEPGLCIANHSEKLKAFTKTSVSSDLVKYELVAIRADGGGGVINLNMMESTGEIVLFLPWEFEPGQMRNKGD